MKKEFRLLVLLTLACSAVAADHAEDSAFDARFQSTYVWQRKGSFNAPYSGDNSLSPQREKSYSFTGTAFLGVRAWNGAELYFNPEVSQGVPLSGLTGLGGFTNGEIARTAGPNPVFYRARLFLRQTWGLGGGREQVEADANQLAGQVDKRRLVLTMGNLSVTDLFDDNNYSHDPRTQFLNWSIMNHGAFDFAADARGYSWGAALEYFGEGWALRGGRFIQPREPNQQRLDYRISAHYGDQIEIEREHRLAGQPGKLRVLAFRNRSVMSSFQDAIDFAQRSGTLPDLNAVRQGERTKVGLGISLEQALTENAGLFGRAMWADGRTETYAFTEIDRSMSGGLLLRGAAWERADDTAGVALARNGLSAAHRSYLAQGGLGFFIGDGTLNYRPEVILEMFYSLAARKGVWLTADYQRVWNPAYNGDRGPVGVGTLRAHFEF